MNKLSNEQALAAIKEAAANKDSKAFAKIYMKSSLPYIEAWQAYKQALPV
jgi:hypothetical protein